MIIWLLEVEAQSGCDYAGLVSVHATPEGAVARFGEWLQVHDIPAEDAYDGATWIDKFLGNDHVLVADGTGFHWGINEMVVGE